MVNEVIYSDLEDSDVKLSGREMTMVIHSNEEASVIS